MAALITVAQAREHIETDLVDAALQRLIDDADAEIVNRFGPHTGDVTVSLEGLAKVIHLPRRASAIVSVTEYPNREQPTTVVLNPNDYRTLWNGRGLERLQYGANPRYSWGEFVTVVFTPVADIARRTRVEADLVKLGARYSGVSQQSSGDFSERSHDEYDSERERILRALGTGIGFA